MNFLPASLTVHPRENCLYKSYKELLQWIPSICDIPPTELGDALQQVRNSFHWLRTMRLKRIQLGQGADSSHTDDTHRLKVGVVNWLMQGTPRPEPPLSTEDKTGQGFYNMRLDAFCVQSTMTGTMPSK